MLASDFSGQYLFIVGKITFFYDRKACSRLRYEGKFRTFWVSVCNKTTKQVSCNKIKLRITFDHIFYCKAFNFKRIIFYFREVCVDELGKYLEHNTVTQNLFFSLRSPPSYHNFWAHQPSRTCEHQHWLYSFRYKPIALELDLVYWYVIGKSMLSFFDPTSMTYISSNFKGVIFFLSVNCFLASTWVYLVPDCKRYDNPSILFQRYFLKSV